MRKIFNVNADCKQNLHYMVDIRTKIEKIKNMVDSGQYFTINRARQYGKTTTLRLLADHLKKSYLVISLDFQMLSHDDFKDESSFVCAFSGLLLDHVENIPLKIANKLDAFVENRVGAVGLSALFRLLSRWCKVSERKIVMIIDEVDSATNNQVFLDFLAQLRGYYINRDITPTFYSVILAGVYDVKNVKRKIRSDDEHKVNSPWNIAADFDVDMSFSAKDIAGMLADYENDYNTGMDVRGISDLLYDYTSGYPFLVSRLCKLMDEKIADAERFPNKNAVWTKNGVLEAVKMLLSEKNTLFESLIGKLNDYPELKNVIYLLLFQGQSIAYNPDDMAMDMALMFGFVKIENNTVQIANRIFETRLYNYFLTLPEVQSGGISYAGRKQLTDYLDHYHLKKGYMLSFCFN